MSSIRVAVMAVLLATRMAAAQPTPVPSPSGPPAASPEAAPDYQLGAGDVLDIVVFGNEDLSRSTTIQPNGVITFPLLGEVTVAGLTTSELQRKLTSLLAKDYLVNPQVEVRVKEYQSQFVFVVGEVNSPGRKPLRGRTRLIDVLVEAGGFNTRASGEISIARVEGGFNEGTHLLKMRLASGTPGPKDQVNLALPLKAGDIITAFPKNYVTVEGEVARPGRYVMEGELTVSGAVSTAGGLTRFGSNHLTVRRLDPETGKAVILEVDLKAVRKGKVPDLALLPNDVVSASRRVF